MRRRDVLVLGAVVSAAIAVPPILRRIPSEFIFEPLRGFDDFRLLRGDAMSGGFDPLLGLDQEDVTQQETNVAATETNPCFDLFGPNGWQAKEVPIAIFSDFNCPYCKVLEAQLVAHARADNGLRLIWHEMPLLGPSSTRAARAVIAGKFLNVETKARRYLWTNGLRPGATSLTRMAQALGLDAERLRRETESARVSSELQKSLSLGARLGLPGTPGIVIGRTLVIGAIKAADLETLISLERRAGPLDCG